jgi:hypothetical protein
MSSPSGTGRVPAASPNAADRAAARRWLLAVALAFVVLHVAVVGLDRPINWDEAIHVSQVNPSVPAVFMEPHRTRGLSLLIAPIAVFDPSMLVLRLGLVFAGGIGLFAAFATWIRVVGIAAPVAAAAFGAHWITVFYAVEVLPNYPSALLGIAVTGLGAQLLTGRDADRRWTYAMVATIALAAAVRPPDAVLIGVGVGLVFLVALRRSAVRPISVLAVGGVAGLAPWLIEGLVRFGFSPMTTVRSAGEYSVGDSVSLFPVYLANLETRLRCAGGCLEDAGGWSLPPGGTVALLLVAATLAGVAVIDTRRSWSVSAIVVVPMVLLIGFYGSAGGAMNLRYVMPVFALGLLLPAVGTVVVWRWFSARSGAWWLGEAMLVILLVVAAWWQIGLGLAQLERPQTRERGYELGTALASVVGDDPCVVATQVNYPQVQYWSGCLAVVLDRGRDGQIQAPLGELGSYVDVAALQAEGYRVFAIAGGRISEDAPVRRWQELSLDIQYSDGFQLYEHRPGDLLPPPPCPPQDGAERLLAEVLSSRC